MAFVVASTAVCELLREPARSARVVAVVPAAVYVEVPAAPGAACGPAWVALLARDAVRVPMGLVTALPRAREPFAGVTCGTAACVGSGEVRLGAGPDDARRAGDRGRTLAFRPLRYWDPGPPRLGGALAAAPVARRAEALALLASGLPDEHVRWWAGRAVPLEVALRPARPDPDAVTAAVAALVGLGPGLTPAGDDVVAGALVTLAAAADEPRRAALATAVGGLLGRTTPVSAALLAQAVLGRSVPQVGGVLRALAGSGHLDAALARLAAVGHTSGAALALGMRAALRARAARRLRRVA